MSTSDATTAAGSELVAELSEAETALEDARDRVAEFGEAELERLAEAHEEFTALLDRYEDQVTGDGDFETFIEFQGTVETLVERLPDDLLLGETFEECDEYLQQRRLTESDFEHVREQLAPVADLASRLEEREQAHERYREARRDVRERLRELDEHIEELRRLERLGEADLDAPTERLREPIDTYDDAVTDAFEQFRREAPAREVFAFLDATTAYPLVPFQSPPDDLREYVETHDAGTEPIPQLLEYAAYSRSKLDHYVADADALKRTVATQQTYLRRLDAEPLTVDWPPPGADRLRFLCHELTAAVNRFAPDAVEQLRSVATLPRRNDYERLREAAVAESELTAAERERLRTGSVREDLDAAVAERERLQSALDEYPER
jgi:phage shock protein A